jgi:hypothetical protein
MNPSVTRVFFASLSVLGLLASAAADASAVTIVKVKKDDLLHGLGDADVYESPFFTSALDGTPVNPSGGWAPTVPTQAATSSAATTTPKRTYNIVGNSTPTGADATPGTSDDWLDGNGVPTGITLSFDAQFTLTALPTGSFFTHPGTAIGVATAGQFGRGLGVTGVAGGPNDLNAGQGFEFTPVTVSNVSFSGTLTDTNFTFSPGSVANFGTVLFRSNNFDETGTGIDGMTLTNQAGETIGFGSDSGTIASNLIVNNNFGSGATPSSFFPRQTGPYQLVSTNEGAVIKGMTLEYDVTYDISPAATGENADFDGDGDVDGQDFLTWQQNVGISSGATQAQGNANPGVDGAVDGADLDVWESQFGAATIVAAAVPEPTSALMAALAVAFGVVASARRRNAGR